MAPAINLVPRRPAKLNTISRTAKYRAPVHGLGRHEFEQAPDLGVDLRGEFGRPGDGVAEVNQASRRGRHVRFGRRAAGQCGFEVGDALQLGLFALAALLELLGQPCPRTQVEASYDELVAEYVTRYGHTPPRSVQMQLAQQATLADRPDKKAGRTLADQVDAWIAAAQAMLPGQDVDAVLAAALGRMVAAAEPVDVAELAVRVVDVVPEHRA